MTDANEGAQKPPRYQLMTVRAMAQNRQPSGGYKQEPDNVSSFPLLLLSSQISPCVAAWRRDYVFLLWFLPLSFCFPCQLLELVGVHKVVCFSLTAHRSKLSEDSSLGYLL